MKPFTSLLVAGACLGISPLVAPLAQGATFHDIYTFKGGTDGASPASGVVADAQGRLYGVTTGGGEYGYGVAYRLSPPTSGQTQWSEEVLHSFAFNDGIMPAGTLAIDSAGNLYGTAPYGGSGGNGHVGYGTVFKLTNGPGWPLTVLHRFGNGSSGGVPPSGVVFGPNGLLWGVTSNFANNTYAESGTLFSLSPLGDSIEYNVVHSFGRPNLGQSGDCFNPVGINVVEGNTLIGGCTGNYGPATGKLFAQEILADGNNPYKIAYTFGNSPDVKVPEMPPLPGAGFYKGIYFGVASQAGAYNQGGVYKLVDSGAGDVAESVIYSFGAQPTDGQPGARPSLIQANASGVLVGTTFQGGTYGQGTFYELDPPAAAGDPWTEQIDVSFNQKESSLGGTPEGTLLMVGKKIYGALFYTQSGYGAVYAAGP